MDRLQKIIASAGVASRRAAETLILQGRVTVNGATVTELGTKADAAADDIRVDGRRVRPVTRFRYLLLNKPRGYVTTRRDPQGRRTVMELLAGVKDAVYPVGRLDYESEGLLLLTNDGDLAAKLTHPRHGVERVYEVTVLGVPDREALDALARGVMIEGRRTAPARVELVAGDRDRSRRRAVLRLTLWEGRNRQVRRMCEIVGHPVERLTRVRIGPVSGAGLRPGQVRDLTPDELRRLRKAAESPPPDRR